MHPTLVAVMLEHRKYSELDEVLGQKVVMVEDPLQQSGEIFSCHLAACKLGATSGMLLELTGFYQGRLRQR